VLKGEDICAYIRGHPCLKEGISVLISEDIRAYRRRFLCLQNICACIRGYPRLQERIYVLTEHLCLQERISVLTEHLCLQERISVLTGEDLCAYRRGYLCLQNIVLT
jgi:hypothetical protein